MITPAVISVLWGVVARASKVPWGWQRFDGEYSIDCDSHDSDTLVASVADEADAVLIVAAVNSLPDLLGEIERLRAAMAGAVCALDHCASAPGVNVHDAREILRKTLGE